jgi:hypothetical protein
VSEDYYWKKPLSTKVCEHAKSCTATSARASKVMRVQPQSREKWKPWNKDYSIASRATELLRFVPKAYDKYIKSEMMLKRAKIEIFYWKSTEKPIGRTVNGNADRRISKPIITMMSYIKNSNRGHSEGKHERSKRDKNSYTGYHRICVNTDVFMLYTTKL